ncbi:radical SAM [Streptomyces himastatinicus ATCC 53653]|uniref:Radical SAM n=1 Tax=Streptomyces himastatinicus ATCC 53653 TaxID=457427 RepID=D9WJU5_9ACTN|nr:radical SAM protein [Streptomyces himastatinicus]EFL23508.1 radical SAM [Streptomyces himastatinicus ATCC 53653]
MTTIVAASPAQDTHFLWLDLTRKCQLQCGPCFNSSGPEGTHGTMTRGDWLRVLDQAADCGVRRVQLIGGEPTLHPDSLALADSALSLGLYVEVYTNLVHVADGWWALLQREGASLATSYYSDQADEHNAVTGRPSHARTLANIKKALRLGVPLRVGIVATTSTQRVTEARQELEALGVKRISIDHVRPYGRGAHGQALDVSGLCGRCGTGRAAVSPDGNVAPCVFSADWLGLGNVQSTPLAAILSGPAMAEAQAAIRSVAAKGGDEDDDGCDPVGDGECSPGYPSSSCSPRN